ncbi:relaxase/mobilization nuclease domain-containing protein [Nitratireductor alexandrii]|uniref:relaxase/mobilization nuclease domain-containing protein n=1 Tax=Nitratireductor alexandrii TaxID=2448161 RepID=UPI000FDC1373|nr:relaxase/mobilization nuclease domain-containing protein [Nitratireductor alexandrii]
MILKGNQRGGAKQLALHLLNDRDNDHVELHAIDGFVADDLTGALREMYAISRATKCKQFMFSLSLSPPKDASATIRDFEDAIDQAMEKLELAGQPRVVLFHEKNARRHCHVVISRIDVDEMKGINLPFFKTRLAELSRELYLSHGWDLPKGLSDKSLANPTNFTLTEWQEAQRAKRDPREIKAVLQHCWAQSDGGQAFEAALKQRGFWLCRGDRRGFVVLDWKGNVCSLSRWLNVKPKELMARLGDPESHRSIEEAKADIATALTDRHKALIAEIDVEFVRRMEPLEAQRRRIRDRHRRERDDLRTRQQVRRQQEAKERSDRLRKGLLGVWDWMTGRRKETLSRNRAELEAANERDQRERLRLITEQRRADAPLQEKRDKAKGWREREFATLRTLSTKQPSFDLQSTHSAHAQPGFGRDACEHSRDA